MRFHARPAGLSTLTSLSIAGLLAVGCGSEVSGPAPMGGPPVGAQDAGADVEADSPGVADAVPGDVEGSGTDGGGSLDGPVTPDRHPTMPPGPATGGFKFGVFGDV